MWAGVGTLPEGISNGFLENSQAGLSQRNPKLIGFLVSTYSLIKQCLFSNLKQSFISTKHKSKTIPRCWSSNRRNNEGWKEGEVILKRR